jgi:hypothetical protein
VDLLGSLSENLMENLLEPRCCSLAFRMELEHHMEDQ